jgi:hypothetical protein
MKYTFLWEVYGSTAIEAESFEKAVELFDSAEFLKTIDEGYSEYNVTDAQDQDGKEYDYDELQDANDKAAEYIAKQALGD